MNTCGTCKYFGEPITVDEYNTETHEIDEFNYHKCGLLKHLNSQDSMPTQEIAGVTDGSGYIATFCVTDEFGCNQWEAK